MKVTCELRALEPGPGSAHADGGPNSNAVLAYDFHLIQQEQHSMQALTPIYQDFRLLSNPVPSDLSVSRSSSSQLTNCSAGVPKDV